MKSILSPCAILALFNVATALPAGGTIVTVTVTNADPNPHATSGPVSVPSSNVVSTPSSGFAFNNGIAYSPYLASNDCKSATQVAKDIAGLASFDTIRLYGTDCNQIANVLAALKGKSTRVFAGIFDITNVASEAQSLISQVNGNWKQIHTVSVGNELIQSGTATVAQVVGAVGQVRSILKAAGYTGYVVTVDTMIAVQNNIALCKASDYCAINCHAFFDGNVLPAGAGSFVRNWVSKISAAAGKPVIVTESGWPNSGSSNGIAVPSVANQAIAVKSIRAAFSSNLILYSAYNNGWMQDNSRTFAAERYWGIYGQAPGGS